MPIRGGGGGWCLFGDLPYVLLFHSYPNLPYKVQRKRKTLTSGDGYDFFGISKTIEAETENDAT